jgi:hypothetical protein
MIAPIADPSTNPISAVAAPPSVEAPLPSPAGASPEADGSAARAELARTRLEAVAARAGLDEAYTDVAETLFQKTGKEPTKENLAAFVAGLKAKQPALFVAANTSPPSSAPHAPAPGVIQSATTKWRALEASGQRADAEAFYLLNRRSIQRGQ